MFDVTALQQLKKSEVFKGARFDVFLPKGEAKKMVVILGQVHTVWRGKIGNRERNSVVRCQERLYRYYGYFSEVFGLKSFGSEGMYEGLETSFQDQRSFQLYREVEKKVGAENILSELGRRWHEALLAKKDEEALKLFATAVCGQTLFQYFQQGKVVSYPIEGEAAYQYVLLGVNHLGERIRKLEDSPEFRAVRQRGGKIKDEKEAEKVRQYNALVREFNAVIGSDLRERATLSLLRERLLHEDLVVLTMGVGHRENYRRLARDFCETHQAVFVFVTPPELLVSWWWMIGIPVLILLALLLMNYFA